MNLGEKNSPKCSDDDLWQQIITKTPKISGDMSKNHLLASLRIPSAQIEFFYQHMLKNEELEEQGLPSISLMDTAFGKLRSRQQKVIMIE